MHTSLGSQIMIRPAYGDDLEALTRLAALDSAPGVPARPLLIAEVDGELLAALSLADGASIADPFHPTAELVALLQAHAGAVRATRGRPRGRRAELSLARG